MGQGKPCSRVRIGAKNVEKAFTLDCKTGDEDQHALFNVDGDSQNFHTPYQNKMRIAISRPTGRVVQGSWKCFGREHTPTHFQDLVRRVMNEISASFARFTRKDTTSTAVITET